MGIQYRFLPQFLQATRITTPIIAELNKSKGHANIECNNEVKKVKKSVVKNPIITLNMMLYPQIPTFYNLNI